MKNNEPFWFYFMFGLLTIFIVWAIILIEYPKRYITLTDGSKVNGWPLNINTWQYNDNNIIIYIIWTLCFIIFIYGCINATYNIITKLPHDIIAKLELYRFIFVSIFKFIIILFVLYYLQHNILASFFSNVFIAVLLIGLIMFFSEIIIFDAWCIYPFFLITIYFIYSDLYIMNMNKDNKNIRNNL